MFDGLYTKHYEFLNLFVKMGWMHYLGYFKTEEIEQDMWIITNYVFAVILFNPLENSGICVYCAH